MLLLLRSLCIPEADFLGGILRLIRTCEFLLHLVICYHG